MGADHTTKRHLRDVVPLVPSKDAQLDSLEGLHREQGRLAAAEIRAIVQYAGEQSLRRFVLIVDAVRDRRVTVEVEDAAREEIAAALRLTPDQARERIGIARLLHSALPGALTALEEGRITYAHACILAEQARRLDGSQLITDQHPGLDSDDQAQARAHVLALCRRFSELALPVAERSTVPRTRDRARMILARIDTEAAERRRQRARGAIDVRIKPLDDGLALLEAWLPAEDAVRVHAALNSRVASSPAVGDQTLGQRRAGALVEALCGSGRSGGSGEPGDPKAGAPATPRIRAEIQVVIDLSVLVGLNDSVGSISCSGGPRHEITPRALRDLLADPTIDVSLRRLVTDPVTGALLDRGRTAYAVSGSLRALLVARDGTCRFPGCNRTAARCEIDHAVAWDDDGPTDRSNLGALCTRHHQLKTHAQWRIIASHSDGSCTWRSPTGREYWGEPPPVLEPV